MDSSPSHNAVPIVLPSNRSFGWLFCLVFALIAAVPLLSGGAIRVWAIGVSGVFAAAALLLPNSLTPLNRAWMRFGALLHQIVSPIVLAVMFFVIITPFGLFMQRFKRNPLGLHREPIDSYWINREPPGPKPEPRRPAPVRPER